MIKILSWAGNIKTKNKTKLLVSTITFVLYISLSDSIVGFYNSPLISTKKIASET